MPYLDKEEKSQAKTLSEELLHNLPEKFLKRLIHYLSINDLLHLSSSCRYFLQIYGSDEIWKLIFEKFFKPLCSYTDYDEVCTNGNYKQLCKQLWQANCHLENIGDLMNKGIPFNASQKTLLDKIFPKDKASNKLCADEADEILHLDNADIKMKNLSISNTTLFENNSNIIKTLNTTSYTKLAATPSTVSLPNKNLILTESIINLKKSKSDILDKTVPNTEQLITTSTITLCEKKIITNININHITDDDLSFNKVLLKKRLDLLLKMSKQFKSPDDDLPGDYTKKYALRYM